MGELLDLEATTFILVPLLAANGSPVLLSKGTPIDLGKMFIDGRRILGDGKTIQGYLLGLLFGLSIGLFLTNIANDQRIFYGAIISVNGGLLGDIIAAFLKRRAGLKRGYPVELLDQLDFLIGGLIALYVAGYVCDPATILVFIPLTYTLHKATNYVAYKLGLKNVPW
ncbi:MAG: CDP-2,3-bis-(O-geranylgeranyl)-sn-glycerol synthase [Pyrodictiaceae archaeon]